MPYINYVPAELPAIASGPNGTVCLDPAIFSYMTPVPEAHKAAVIYFILGMLVGAAIMYLRQRWCD